MDQVAELLTLQAGVITRAQVLGAGMTDADLRRLLRQRRLVRVHRSVYVDHTGPLTWLQRAWAAILALEPAALCAESALRAAEGPGKRTESLIHVAVDSARRVADLNGVVIVRMDHLASRAMWNASPPRLRYEDAALDVAVAAPSDFAALGVVAEAIQSRRTTAVRMLGALADRRRCARRRWLTGVLDDFATGSCSVLEFGYLRHVERAHGLPRARRQVRSVATLGVTLRDVQYDGLVVELDGRLFHDTARQRDRDLDRDLDAAVDGSWTVRIGYGQVFDRPCATAVRIAVLLQRDGWSGVPRACGDGCDVSGRTSTRRVSVTR